MTDLDSRQRDRVDYADYLDDETSVGAYDYDPKGYGDGAYRHGDGGEDDEDYDEPVDHRWRPVAVTAGGVLLAAVIGTAVILNGGGDGGTAGTIGPPSTRTVTATPPPATSAPAATALPPETVTTVTPSAAPTVPSATATPEAAAPPPVDPRTVTYQVTGTKGLLDLVTVTYTDALGHPHTDFNAALPWTKMIVLNPGVELKSVVATSLSGRLNCGITDAQGQAIVASTNNSIIATCTR